MQKPHPSCWAVTGVLWRKLGFILILLSGASNGNAAPNYRVSVDKLSVGMTGAQVTALLGTPDSQMKTGNPPSNGEAWYFRFSTLAKNAGSGSTANSTDTQILMGRIRCRFIDGVLSNVAGLWPKPERPLSGVPKTKILLVDVADVYDRIALTHATNERLKKLEAEAQRGLETLNEEGKQLVAGYRKATDQLKHFKGSAEEKDALRQRTEAILESIKAKQSEVEHFTAERQAALQSMIARYKDFMLPAISEAILRFKTERGYDYVYEIKQNIFAPGTKPMFVSGVDETDAIVKWIDSGADKGAGY